jgi:prepilin-type N-terminal cleavage/methylation domain-containing protein
MSGMTHERGYSLVELLVVLALMGLIAIAMSGGIRFGARVWERTGAQVETLEQTQGAQALLRTVLSRVAPRIFDPGVAAQDTFVGSGGQMIFTATMPPALGSGGLARITLQATPSAEGVALQIAWRPERGERTERRQILLRGARAVSFSYAKAEAGAPLVWTDSWAADAGTPALIRIRAEFAQRQAYRWPELIVRARIDRDSSCIFDPVSFECRRG